MTGLYRRYEVKRVDGKADAERYYFVLNLATDPHARVAARAYAESVQADEPALANDLRGAARLHEVLPRNA